MIIRIEGLNITHGITEYSLIEISGVTAHFTISNIKKLLQKYYI
jgi:hypothetical protein